MFKKIFLIIPFIITGCTLFSIQEPAPVVDIMHYIPVVNGTHMVQRGETLYEIAWRYGRDFRDIALANHIVSPYVIYPGQRLDLRKPNAIAAKRYQADQKLPKKPEVTVQKTQPETSKPQATISPPIKGWAWPARGKILKKYATGQGIKGIDIGGQLGQEVKAASKGKVVYSGSGLRGYGNLIIIKHNETYLSAYGHNSRLLVKEGDEVNAGQKIAEMGQSDAAEVKLHFEIRKNGQPINPLTLLPE